MYDGILLKNVKSASNQDGELIYLWEYIPIINKYDIDDIRVYYKPNETLGSGVEIFVLEFISASSETPWDENSMCVQVIYHAICYFDGLRHLYMNSQEDESQGYLYYVDLLLHIEVYKEMQKLVEKYCRDWN